MTVISHDFSSARRLASLRPADSEDAARSIRIAPGRAAPILRRHPDYWHGWINGCAFGVMVVSLIAVLTWP